MRRRLWQVDAREHSMQTIAANVEEQHCDRKYTHWQRLIYAKCLIIPTEPIAKTEATLCANGELKMFSVKANRPRNPRTKHKQLQDRVLWFFWQKSSRLTLSGAQTSLKSGSPAAAGLQASSALLHISTNISQSTLMPITPHDPK